MLEILQLEELSPHPSSPSEGRRYRDVLINSYHSRFSFSFHFDHKQTLLRPLDTSVVKEEIIDDNTVLPCFNNKVVCWVSEVE